MSEKPIPIRLRETKPQFTPRQVQVVRLIAAGLTNEEVGAALGISPRTARAHTDELRRRLDVDKRRQIAAAYALATGDCEVDWTAARPVLGVLEEHRESA